MTTVYMYTYWYWYVNISQYLIYWCDLNLYRYCITLLINASQYSKISIYVTGFVKTLHVHIRVEIHFIAYCNINTRALSIHNNKTGIDKQICFYRWPVCQSCQVMKSHNRSYEILGIFQTCISQNPGKCICGGFSKIRSHIVPYHYSNDIANDQYHSKCITAISL